MIATPQSSVRLPPENGLWTGFALMQIARRFCGPAVATVVPRVTLRRTFCAGVDTNLQIHRIPPQADPFRCNGGGKVERLTNQKAIVAPLSGGCRSLF
jgi:hypothetical protein